MRRIIITLTLILTSFALAQDLTPKEAAQGATMILARDLNAATCHGQLAEAFDSLDGACYELEYISNGLHRTMIDSALLKYRDIKAISAWITVDQGHARMYELDGITLTLIIADFGNGSVAGFVIAE